MSDNRPKNCPQCYRETHDGWFCSCGWKCDENIYKIEKLQTQLKDANNYIDNCRKVFLPIEYGRIKALIEVAELSRKAATQE